MPISLLRFARKVAGVNTAVNASTQSLNVWGAKGYCRPLVYGVLLERVLGVIQRCQVTTDCKYRLLNYLIYVAKTIWLACRFRLVEHRGHF